jgi:prevent-host-death family protein
VKTIAVEKSNLKTCVDTAQQGRVLVTKNGEPIAVMIGVAGLDREQVALGSSPEFWKLIARRRKEPTISKADLQARLKSKSRRHREKRPG